MPSLKRDAPFAAIFAKLESLPSLRTTSRRLKHWKDVRPEQQPAAYLAVGDQRGLYSPGKVTFWDLDGTIYVYAHAGASAGMSDAPGATLNALLDEVLDTVFAVDNVQTNACTLGGLVHWARVTTIETDEGTLGDQAVARIGFQLHAPAG